MTRDETLKVLAILKAAYPSSYNGMTKREANGVVAVWYMQFEDIAVDIVLMAVQKCISNSKFPPAISEVKEKISSLHWEANEMIYGYGTKQLPADLAQQYQRIYDETKAFKYSKTAEPSLGKMLSGSKMLQLESGAE